MKKGTQFFGRWQRWGGTDIHQKRWIFKIKQKNNN